MNFLEKYTRVLKLKIINSIIIFMKILENIENAIFLLI